MSASTTKKATTKKTTHQQHERRFRRQAERALKATAHHEAGHAVFYFDHGGKLPARIIVRHMLVNGPDGLERRTPGLVQEERDCAINEWRPSKVCLSLAGLGAETALRLLHGATLHSILKWLHQEMLDKSSGASDEIQSAISELKAMGVTDARAQHDILLFTVLALARWLQQPHRWNRIEKIAAALSTGHCGARGERALSPDETMRLLVPSIAAAPKSRGGKRVAK